MRKCEKNSGQVMKNMNQFNGMNVFNCNYNKLHNGKIIDLQRICSSGENLRRRCKRKRTDMNVEEEEAETI